MKYFPMVGEINTEMEQKFIEWANINETEPWSIVLNTPGGSFFATEMITRIIDAHQDCEIIVQAAYSSGFIILMEAKCKKVLSKTCRGMWHYGKWSIELNDKNKPYYYEDECILRNMDVHKKQSERIARKAMTAKEFKKFKSDESVYFDFNRMREIFPDAEIMK